MEKPGYKNEMDNLNDLLESHTDSEDPDTNLDVVLKEFNSDIQKQVPYNSSPVQSKRLVLALRTLNGENECDYYSHEILLNNLMATGNRIRALSGSVSIRRIDRILKHYVDKHVENCGQVYFDKFDELSKNLDPNLVDHIDEFLRNEVEIRTSNKNPENAGKNYVEILYRNASHGGSEKFRLDTSYIYNALKYFAKGDTSFLKPVKDGKSDALKVDKGKLSRLFQDHIAKPCNDYRQQLGPDVFEPVLFDKMFKDHQVRSDKPEFYRAWLMYRLCNFFGEVSYTVDRLADYANNQ